MTTTMTTEATEAQTTREIAAEILTGRKVDAHIADARAEVVSRTAGFAFTRGELADLFDRVANDDHWKNPIDKAVALTTSRERFGLDVAIQFFTGSKASFEILNRQTIEQSTRAGVVKVTITTYHVKAAGYFATVGA
jgi:hypothetical protein